jgi:hypothetical protein
MSETLFAIIGIALLIFLLSRGGMGAGCCGGHSHHRSPKPEENGKNGESAEKKDDQSCH